MIKKGTILKFSEEGINHLYKYASPQKRNRVRLWRFEFVKYDDKEPEIIHVRTVWTKSHHLLSYHISFLNSLESSKGK